MKKKYRKLAIGVDVGGSGIKGAPVDLTTGEFAAARKRIPTPPNGTPEEIATVIRKVVREFDLPRKVPVGITFPAPITNGKVRFMANLNQDFVGMNVTEFFADALDREVVVLNDADAAGYAETHFGAAQMPEHHTAVVLTLGTGIGSALVRDGVLVPNTEMGHLVLLNGMTAEQYASCAVYENEELSFPQWAERLQVVFSYIEKLFSPDLMIIGGGISKKHQEFLPLIDTTALLVPAKLRNAAGIVGAALLAKAAATESE
ncbi:MAG: ROK family protein [Trueperella sp.]|nr:ROK family protein [Trueperella sp.]